MSGPSDLISVSILDREYQFTCPAEEREALKAAALHLDEKMREVRSAGNLLALERIAVMTALNLSDEILKLRSTEEQRHDKVDLKIKSLADELDNALSASMD
ncbi:MAG: cell division protein ZapA [Xanthomonadales bacterium]|nr:cell division protein ZapA [Gammaproteobacteria bacterium]NNE06486.1 cell division protein ZapA [Xanthomonadales bacterium]NNL96421.1 cell division protein ZapA [Xanthomonadales bacterium]